MKKYYIGLLMMAAMISSAADSFAKKRKVLFIGNSYIHTNNMPGMLEQLTTAMGDTLVYNQNTPGGYTLQAHSTDATTLSRIASDEWDVVVIHEQSQRPAFPQTQVETQVYPFAKDLYDAVKANNACTEVMFMMTWGYKNGDATNCAFHPPICTYGGMQGELRFSYMKMAQDNNSNVAPVGAAWNVVRDSFPSIELYSPDNSHPSVSGSYLEACVLYASIFHRSPMGTSYLGGVVAADAAKLQRIAAKVTLDSLENWQQYGNMAFSDFTIGKLSHNVITLQNDSRRAGNYAWDFGDGTTSTQVTPVAKTYTAHGDYVVKLVASNSCNSDSKVDTAKTGWPQSVESVNNSKAAYVYQDDKGRSYLQVLHITAGHKELTVFDMHGRKVQSAIVPANAHSILIDVAPGTYIYKLQSSANEIASGKFVQQ